MFFYYTIFLDSDTVKSYHLTRKTSQVTEIFPILKDSTNQTHRSLFEVFGAVRGQGFCFLFSQNSQKLLFRNRPFNPIVRE
jgi:hypothetical protein